jgi:hypothetical protein
VGEAEEEDDDNDGLGKKGLKRPRDDGDNHHHATATPTTCNETMSDISSRGLAFTGGGPPSTGGGFDLDSSGRAHHHHHPRGGADYSALSFYRHPPSSARRSHPSPPFSTPHPSSPHLSLGSFSAITIDKHAGGDGGGGGSASAYYASAPPPPPPGSAGGGIMGNDDDRHRPRQPYVYQYQHFDPRSHLEVPHHPSTKKAPQHRPPPLHLAGGGGGQHRLANGAAVGDPLSSENNHRRAYYGGGVGNNHGGGNNNGAQGGGAAVPPTVHMPNVPGGFIKDVSPLTNHHHHHHHSSGTAKGLLPMPSTRYFFGGASSPGEDGSEDVLAPSPEDGAAAAIAELRSGGTPGGGGDDAACGKMRLKSSPLDLLSSVSTSPVIANLTGKVSMRLSSSGGGAACDRDGAAAPPSYSMHQHHYPAAAPVVLSSYAYPRWDEDDGVPDDAPSSSTTANDLAATPVALPRQSNLELMLSAANTLDIDESKRAKRRKLSAENANTVKKRLLLLNKREAAAPTATTTTTSAHGFGGGPGMTTTATGGLNLSLFSVGDYPPGFDPSTLPPSRSSLKPNSKVTKAKFIDSGAVEQARQALTLAKQALERPRVGKQLLLSMALVRTNPRTPPSCYPANGTILTDRFHWASFPPLDTILRKNMRRYYELSTNKCQSKDQQEFNNELVVNVKREAHKYGWEFDNNAFDDKKIRDRIRCFYKVRRDLG